MSSLRMCSCGSGEVKYQQFDARGIFLTYVCNACRDEKLSHYRPDVLTNPNYAHDEPLDEE